MERKVLLQALTGSHNYNLAEEGSDKDYKVFTAPTFEDLYNGHFYKKNIVSDTVDKDIKDIRQLPDLLWKSNISYLELLYSKDIDCVGSESLIDLLSLKDEIVKMNLPKLFTSTGGTFNQRMKKLDHGTDGTQHLVDLYGYNTKEAMHAYRSLKLIIDYGLSGFNDFGKTLRCEDWLRGHMLAIKHGMMEREEFVEFINLYHNNFFVPLKDLYCSQMPNFELKKHIDSLIMNVVEEEIEIELDNK